MTLAQSIIPIFQTMQQAAQSSLELNREIMAILCSQATNQATLLPSHQHTDFPPTLLFTPYNPIPLTMHQLPTHSPTPLLLHLQPSLSTTRQYSTPLLCLPSPLSHPLLFLSQPQLPLPLLNPPPPTPGPHTDDASLGRRRDR